MPVPLHVERHALRVRDRFHGRRRNRLLEGPGRGTHPIPTNTSASAAIGCARATAATSCASRTSSRRRCSSIVCSSWPWITRRRGGLSERRARRAAAPVALTVTRAPRPPVAATTSTATTCSTVRRDRSRVSGRFALLTFEGMRRLTRSTLDLGARPRAVLLLTGWTDYAFSTDNVAAHQRGLALRRRRSKVRTRSGAWRTVMADIGIPVGRPQTRRRRPAGSSGSAMREVRIVTNMRIYWDQILVDRGGSGRLDALTRAGSVRRRSRAGAASRPKYRPTAGSRSATTIKRDSHDSPWKTMTGTLHARRRRAELLRRVDDMFVDRASRRRDRLVVRRAALPPLAAGWTRTFLLYADGYSKEMDITSASPDTVAPLPFHGDDRYPYGADERYRLDDERYTRISRALQHARSFRTRVDRARSTLPGCGQSDDFAMSTFDTPPPPARPTCPTRSTARQMRGEHRPHAVDDRLGGRRQRAVPAGAPRGVPGVRARGAGLSDRRRAARQAGRADSQRAHRSARSARRASTASTSRADRCSRSTRDGPASSSTRPA